MVCTGAPERVLDGVTEAVTLDSSSVSGGFSAMAANKREKINNIKSTPYPGG